MFSRSVTFGIVTVSTMMVTAAVVYRTLLYSRRPVKVITEKEFLEIMKIISQNIFTRLFEFAQAAQRIPEPSAQVLSSSVVVCSSLDSAQAAILTTFDLTEEDMKSAQNRYYKKGNIQVDTVVESVGNMFEAFLGGNFPELPESILPEKEVDDELVLETVRLILGKKVDNGVMEHTEEKVLRLTPFESMLEFNNLVSKKINRGEENFKRQIFEIVIQNQNLVKEKYFS